MPTGPRRNGSKTCACRRPAPRPGAWTACILLYRGAAGDEQVVVQLKADSLAESGKTGDGQQAAHVNFAKQAQAGPLRPYQGTRPRSAPPWLGRAGDQAAD